MFVIQKGDGTPFNRIDRVLNNIKDYSYDEQGLLGRNLNAH